MKYSFISHRCYKFAHRLNYFNMITNRIKVVLVEKNRTGLWLAEQIGKSKCSVSKYCQNQVQPDLKTLEQIANALDVDVKDLLNSTK